jgi:hypothetical protein
MYHLFESDLQSITTSTPMVWNQRCQCGEVRLSSMPPTALVSLGTNGVFRAMEPRIIKRAEELFVRMLGEPCGDSFRAEVISIPKASLQR